MFAKIIAVVFIGIGETLSISAELFGSKKVSLNPTHFTNIFWSMFTLVTLGGAFLVAGYMLGYMHLKNMWIVMAVSIGAIVVMEPLIIFILFKQAPTAGAVIGLILGILGILAALLIP